MAAGPGNSRPASAFAIALSIPAMFVRRPLGDARSRSLEAGEPIAEAIFVKIALTVTEAALTPIKGTSGPAAYPDMAMIRLFLAGDGMTGRGIEQILHRPGEPQIFEDCLKSALGPLLAASRTLRRYEEKSNE